MSTGSLTIHWLHILMQYVLAMAELESNSNLITNLNNLAFRKMLAAQILAVRSDRQGKQQLTQLLEASAPADPNPYPDNNP
jgi:hypothetical protein